LITEYVKSWATQKRQVTTFDQVYLFGKQMQYEYRFLNNGIKNVVTDSPLILSCVYADYYYPEMKLGQHLLTLSDLFALSEGHHILSSNKRTVCTVL